MKILVVTNLYPPQHIGGYELGCRDVVEKLRGNGHQVRVLTSSFTLPANVGANVSPETDIERSLIFSLAGSFSLRGKFAECRKLVRAAKSFCPNVIYFWNQAGLCLWLPLAARRQGLKTAFYLSDTNFISWRAGAWLAGLARGTSLLARVTRSLFGRSFLVRGQPVVQDQPCHFASRFLKEAGERNGIQVARENSLVVHWGVAFESFPWNQRDRWPLKKLLYAGQMIEAKGVHTAVGMLAILKDELPELTLTLAGGALYPEYENTLRALAQNLGVAGRVNFLGKVPRADLPRIYAGHDALVFPSEWEEPFAITPLEAMASGLAVIGTTTGGSGELFQNRQTAMTFQAGDALDGARAIRELAADRRLFETVLMKGRQRVLENHSLETMVTAIEQSLQTISAA